jgi:hypothetical protein
MDTVNMGGPEKLYTCMRSEAKSWHESKTKQTHLVEPKCNLKSEE